MRTFKDTNGVDWQIAINIDTIKRVRDLCKINLYQLVENNCKLLTELQTDVILLADVLYSIVKPQADQRNISDVDFGRSLSGDVLWNGFNGLLDELADFFPDPRQRTILKKLIEKTRAATGMMMDQSERELDAIDPAKLSSEVQQTLKNSRGSSLASLVSTPDL